MTKAELDAVELVGAAAICSQTQAWKVLEKQILAKLLEAERRGVIEGGKITGATPKRKKA